jgi:transcriptional regulator with XRE-family HTH domain
MLSRGRGEISTVADWPQRVIALRKQLGENQVKFGKRFEVTQTTVSYWESGRKEPSAKNYVRMGNLADQPGCYWFWKKAGVDVDRMRTMLTQQTDKA